MMIASDCVAPPSPRTPGVLLSDVLVFRLEEEAVETVVDFPCDIEPGLVPLLSLLTARRLFFDCDPVLLDSVSLGADRLTVVAVPAAAKGGRSWTDGSFSSSAGDEMVESGCRRKRVALGPISRYTLTV